MDRLNLQKLYVVAGWVLLSCCTLIKPQSAHAVPWFPFGPDGGDARAFAPDPHDHLHLYLGTANGWIYDTHDGGRSWKRLARIGRRDDLVLDNIVVDALNPQHLVVGAWVIDHPDGGLYLSNDGGQSWTSQTEMRGQSIRALSQSASDPRELVAGTLQGVFRSVDSGLHWRLISPAGSRELHEVESVAIDPRDPNTLYAGTWHLPWKTTDGGLHWENMKDGIIEDSDVFSIIVDPATPQTLYLSACSGIYKSVNAGVKFDKVTGIPSSARRTRVLMQDPKHLNIVFAGTTEGLFRSGDSGQTWQRTTGPEMIVNDVNIDVTNPDHMMIATDRGGVLYSSDGGFSFRPSNRGFSARQITSFAQDARHPATVYVGVVNDKDFGGVFESEDGGLSWFQQSAGLQGRDVFALARSSNGTILAGTTHGIFHLDAGVWRPSQFGAAVTPTAPVRRAGQRSIRVRSIRVPSVSSRSADATVNGLAVSDGTVYAATTSGLFSSVDDGASWSPVRGVPVGSSADPTRFVAAAHQHIVAGGIESLVMSADGGRTWKSVRLPEKLPQLGALTVTDAGEIWAGGREGVFTTVDGGLSWQPPANLLVSGVNSLYYDVASQRILLTALGATSMAFSVQLPSHASTFTDTGWNLRFVRPVGDHLVAATLFDGIVVQPVMVASPINGPAAATH